MSKITKEELKRWGFSQRLNGDWYNSHLCMILKVHKVLNTKGGLDELDFIQAVYEHGRMNGISEMQEQIQRTIGIN